MTLPLNMQNQINKVRQAKAHKNKQRYYKAMFPIAVDMVEKMVNNEWSNKFPLEEGLFSLRKRSWKPRPLLDDFCYKHSDIQLDYAARLRASQELRPSV